MISKILFTAAVIAAVFAFVQFRRDRAARTAVPAPREAGEINEGWRYLAYAAIFLILVGSAFFMALEWRDATEVVQVRVIDAGSGRSVSYQAYVRDVDDRSFRTLDGRRIVLAETERLELGGSTAE